MTDPNKMVTVTLDKDAMYRVRHEDKTAITVKKGVPTEVPFWVAEHWGVLPTDDPVGPSDVQADTSEPKQAPKSAAKTLKTSKKGG
jgi:hypothetical protein